MDTFRIKIEQTSEGFKHVKNITIDTDNIESIISKIEKIVNKEKELAQKRFYDKIAPSNVLMKQDEDLTNVQEVSFL